MQNSGTDKSLIRRWLELIRFSHTVFALPFAALACVWALVVPRVSAALTGAEVAIRLVGVLLCMVTARSAAMAFNRLVDARFDGDNPRTAKRHLPAGELTHAQAWIFFAIMAMGFLGSCTLFLPNWLPLAFSGPVLLWICGYSLAKRFTAAVHLWLGVALALSPVCAWMAIRGEEVIAVPADILPALGLGLAIAFWVAGFDIIYACQDADFDQQAGLYSVPGRWGVARALRIALGMHLVMLVVLVSLALMCSALSLGWIYGLTVVGVGCLVVRQHVIISPSNLSRVNEAFFVINAVISFCLSAFAAIDAVWR